jgi:hypothetical protein
MDTVPLGQVTEASVSPKPQASVQDARLTAPLEQTLAKKLFNVAPFAVLVLRSDRAVNGNNIMRPSLNDLFACIQAEAVS